MSGGWTVERARYGYCKTMLHNLGLEARSVEPQPCGAPAMWLIENQLACTAHIGVELELRWEKEMTKEFPKPAASYCTMDEMLDGHRHHCPHHESCFDCEEEE